MNKTLMALIALLLLCPGVQAKPLPNIVYIIIDDMGYADLGCYGGEAIQTPHNQRSG